MHISIEGLPALGKSEILSVLRLYYPHQVAVFPELVNEVAEQEGSDLLRDRARLSKAIWAALPERERRVRDALAAEKIVLEESHLGVHAAYSAALGAYITMPNVPEPITHEDFAHRFRPAFDRLWDLAPDR